MSRVHPRHRPIGLARAPAALAVALMGVIAGGLLTRPAEAGALPTRAAASLQRAKPLKALPALKAGVKPARALGMVSPYAQAAAQRNESGRLPPGHAYIPRPTADLSGQSAP